MRSDLSFRVESTFHLPYTVLYEFAHEALVWHLKLPYLSQNFIVPLHLKACGVLDADLVIVLDDFHLVQENSAVKDVINFILRSAIPGLHLVLISRVSIALELSHLKGQQQLLEVTSAELAFSLRETARLFKDFLLQTSILTCLQASFCDHWLGIDVSQCILTLLSSRHLVVHLSDSKSGGYVYHHMFRVYLQNRTCRVFISTIIS